MFSLSRAVPESRVFEADCSCSSFPSSLIPFDRFVPLCRTLLFAKFVLKVKPEGFSPRLHKCQGCRGSSGPLGDCGWVCSWHCLLWHLCLLLLHQTGRFVLLSPCCVGQVVLGEVSFAPNLAPIAKVGVVAGGGVPNGKGQGLSVVYEGC